MRIKIIFLLIRGKIRLLWGLCPSCNSDAPELYDCQTCNYYSSASGHKFPPTQKTKSDWWNLYKEGLDNE